MKKAALSDVKDDLSKFLRLAEKEEVAIIRTCIRSSNAICARPRRSAASAARLLCRRTEHIQSGSVRPNVEVSSEVGMA